MRRSSISVALLVALVMGAVSACSEDEGSTVDNSPAKAGTHTTSGGSVAVAGTASTLPKAGTTGSSTSSSGGMENVVASSKACPGLPIQPSGSAGASGDATAGAGGDSSTNDTACNGVSVEAEAVPVDLFVIMDRSQSMGVGTPGGKTTRWGALRAAVQSFAEASGAADIRAGIGFFSLSGSGDDGHDCNPDAYAEPRVPIGLLADVGPELVSAMNEVTPGGFTPIVPALQGAIGYARSWARENPGRGVLVVLVSDGFPTQCENDPAQISDAARVGYESPEHIRTFVIGVGDVAKFNLDSYARAGGTQHAFLTEAGDITNTFVSALNNITNRELACEYQLPPPPDGMKLDPEKVQVVYTPASGDPEEVPSIGSLGACAKNPNGGWYYDDANNPSKISVCPCTCTRFQAGRVDVRLGCKPRLGLR